MKEIVLGDEFISEIEKASVVAQYLWERNWAERNGGNISINFTDIFFGTPTDLKFLKHVKLEKLPAKSAGMVLFATGSGLRLRDMNHPEQTGCVLRIDDNAEGYYILWGGNSLNFKATSEIIPHIKIHLAKMATGSKHRVIVHTHPTELIAFSHHPELGKDEKTFNKSLWSMLPEVRAFVPNGVALLPYTLPGSEKLADLTANALLGKDVAIWSKHGAVATGIDAQDAFDYIDVANKGAIIFLKCLSCGFTPEGLTDADLDELARVFNL